MQLKSFRIIVLAALILSVTGCAKKVDKVDKFAIDCDAIRGFNYTPASVAAPRHHTDSWVKYDENTTVFDMDLAKELDLNMARVFVNYQAYQELGGEELARRLQHFCRVCEERGIGVIPVVGNGAWVRDTTQRDLAREWAEFLVGALKDEPALAMWDIHNEPDSNNPERRAMNFSNCRFLSGLFHELDPNTPVTIGAMLVPGMIELADYVDILQFHDYSETREGIKEQIKAAREFSQKVGKPVFNGELGCIARANPYDVTLEEHQNAGMGWVIWELMIVREGWGNVHGVFYEDGTVRDPSIYTAIKGHFRNRKNIRLEEPDSEGKVTSVLRRIDAWKADGAKDFDKGADLAEVAANLLESAQLAPMHIAPLYEVNQVRESRDLKELTSLLQKYSAMLEPYKRQ
jgi:hypothetical protein